MLNSAKIKRYMFWELDKIKNSKIKYYLDDIKDIINLSNPTKTQNNIENKLYNILNHATHTTKYYSAYNIEKGLSEFPVVNKSVIKENMNQFISNCYNNNDLVSVITSGSTGTPFLTYQDINKKRRNYADAIYFANIAGYEIGEDLFYFKIWVKSKMKNRLIYALQSIIPVDVIKLDEKQLIKVLKNIKISKCPNLLGYSSVLELLVKCYDKNFNKIGKIKLKSAISMSESLSYETKLMFKELFNVNLVSRYSNLENGIIAQELINTSGSFKVNTASYFVELLQIESDEPAKPGELGRIVVTDYYNYAMPFIRYDTGDLGVFESDSENKINNTILKRVEGRLIDQIYDTQGNFVSSYIVYKNMWQYTEIKQYQLIQEKTDRYRIKINIKERFNHEEKLISEFIEFLGKNAIIEIEYVDEIPLLSSGKRKKIVNMMK